MGCRKRLPLLPLLLRFKVLLRLQLGHQAITELNILLSRRVERQWLERPMMLRIGHLELCLSLLFCPVLLACAFFSSS
jgi:hypothetical protein